MAVLYFIPSFKEVVPRLIEGVLYKGGTILSKVTSEASTPGTWSITTGRIVTAGVLVAITIILGVIPGIGFIPLPNLAGSATIEHIPTILGGVLEGPLVGMVTGLAFGLLSFTRATIPLFKDPLVAILPRILIGLTAWGTFAGLYRFNRTVAAAAAGFVGAATNTILVLGIAILRGYFPPVAVIPIIPQAVAEAIIAAILTTIIASAVYIVRARLVRAPDTKPRDQLPY
jgi:uncharacterized membrane protein